VTRDLQRQYTRYRLGYLWTILEPLGMTVVLALVFTALLGPRRLGEQPYILFLSMAILPWWWFTRGTAAMTQVFHRTKGQLRNSLLPTEIWVLRVLIVSFVEFVFSLPVILLAMLVTRTLPGPLIVLYPLGVVLQLLLMLGLGLAISAWAVVVPDLARVVRIVLRAMFYLTPVLYALSNIPEAIRPFAALNPVIAPIGLYRVGFWPDEHEAWPLYAVSVGLCLAILGIGIVVFKRLERRILKEA
jgi:ABC-2 type transport system permease protein